MSKRLNECLNDNFEKEYIKHIIHIKELLENVDNIALATDDMTYYKIEPEIYQNFNVFKQEKIKYRVEKLLIENGFTNHEIKKINGDIFRVIFICFISFLFSCFTYLFWNFWLSRCYRRGDDSILSC